jgi:hypothetical protein
VLAYAAGGIGDDAVTRSRHGGGHGGPLANPNFLALDLASVHRIDDVAPPSPLVDGPVEHRGRAVVREAEHVEPSARRQHLPRRLKLHRRELQLAPPPVRRGRGLCPSLAPREQRAGQVRRPCRLPARPPMPKSSLAASPAREVDAYGSKDARAAPL